MKVELWLKIISDNHVEASKIIGADSFAALPMPVPVVGEHIMVEIDGTIYCGLVTQKEIDITEIEDQDGVLKINIFADEQTA